MSDQVLTTQTTASTEVAHLPPMAPRAYDTWGVIGIVLAGIVGTITATGGLLAIIGNVRGWLRDRNSDERQQASEQRAQTLDGQRTILARMDENKTELRQLIEERTSGLEGRVAKIEREYRTEAELDRDYGRLEQRVEHEKGNRLTGHEQLLLMNRELGQRVTILERGHARLEALQEATAGNVAEVKQAVDRLGDRIDDRFDKLMDSMTARPAH